MVFIASNLGVWLCLRADPRKLKREKVQNPTSAKIATLENVPLYGITFQLTIVSWVSAHGHLNITCNLAQWVLTRATVIP